MISNLQIEQLGPLIVASMPADVDLASSTEIGERLANGIDQRARALIVDLSETTYLDSAGLHMLLRLGVLLRQGRRDLVLVVPLDSPLRRFFEIVTLPPALPLRSDLDSVLAELA